MTMKPILFNTEMVRAILEGRKTVTRRVVKFQNGSNPQWSGYIPDGSVLYGSNNVPVAKAPYTPGDILYVLEMWAHPSAAEIENGADSDMCIYKADAPLLSCAPFRWHPSIHMPKKAARLFLRVKSVRVERLKDITEKQALSEGIEPVYLGDGEFAYAVVNPDALCSNPKVAFSTLWNSTIKTADLDKYGWAANPWVWVIEFERCEKPQEVPHE